MKATATEVVVAFIWERAAQYRNDSASKCALEDLASEFADGEHFEAHRHGELDDLIAQHRKQRAVVAHMNAGKPKRARKAAEVKR